MLGLVCILLSKLLLIFPYIIQGCEALIIKFFLRLIRLNRVPNLYKKLIFLLAWSRPKSAISYLVPGQLLLVPGHLEIFGSCVILSKGLYKNISVYINQTRPDPTTRQKKGQVLQACPPLLRSSIIKIGNPFPTYP